MQQNIIKFTAALTLVSLPLIAGAVTLINLPTNVSRVEQLLDKVCNIVNLIFTILLIVAVIFIVIAAFTYITGGGDPENVSKASRQILWAVIAVVLATFSKILPVVASNFLGTGISGTSGC